MGDGAEDGSWDMLSKSISYQREKNLDFGPRVKV
jgi:hypothetical protein